MLACRRVAFQSVDELFADGQDYRRLADFKEVLRTVLLRPFERDVRNMAAPTPILVGVPLTFSQRLSGEHLVLE
jgi:hypothetical protein